MAGTRTIITTANNKSIMLLWYRNEVFAVESRSPAEVSLARVLHALPAAEAGCCDWCPHVTWA